MDPAFTDQDFWNNLLDMLEKQFGSNCEIVLHDLRKDCDHTIIDIRNGHNTGRKIGDCGSNIGLEVQRGTVADGNRYNYITHNRNGKIFRSSTLFIKDSKGCIKGSLSINLDISETIRFEEYLIKYNLYEPSPDSTIVTDEILVNDVSQLFDRLCQEAQKNSGKDLKDMDRNDKIEFVRFLDKRGAFLISKSSEKAYEYLNVSKFTFYKYLDLVRSKELSKGID